MAPTQRFEDEDIVARQYGYADGDVLAFDLGPGAEATVDVVDGTLLIVTGDEQYDVDLPAGASGQATLRNGVVSIEVDETAAEPAETTDTEADR